MLEERKGDAFHPEADTGGVRDLFVVGPQLPQLAEMILVVVETHAGGQRRRIIDRYKQFEFQSLLALSRSHDLAGSAEERIVGEVNLHGQA